MTISLIISVSLFTLAMAYPSGSEERGNYSILVLQYRGALDKPIGPVIISDSKTKAERYRYTGLNIVEADFASVHVVPDSLLEKLIAETESGKVIAQPKDMDDPMFSFVAATVITPQRRKTFLYEKQSAISFLDHLQKYCQDREALRSALSYFQDRVRPLVLEEGGE